MHPRVKKHTILIVYLYLYKKSTMHNLGLLHYIRHHYCYRCSTVITERGAWIRTLGNQSKKLDVFIPWPTGLVIILIDLLACTHRSITARAQRQQHSVLFSRALRDNMLLGHFFEPLIFRNSLRNSTTLLNVPITCHSTSTCIPRLIILCLEPSVPYRYSSSSLVGQFQPLPSLV